MIKAAVTHIGDDIGRYLSSHLYTLGVSLSTGLDGLMGIVLTVLLLLRLFQLKQAGVVILPVLGVYVVLKVLLP